MNTLWDHEPVAGPGGQEPGQEQEPQKPHSLEPLNPLPVPGKIGLFRFELLRNHEPCAGRARPSRTAQPVELTAQLRLGGTPSPTGPGRFMESCLVR